MERPDKWKDDIEKIAGVIWQKSVWSRDLMEEVGGQQLDNIFGSLLKVRLSKRTRAAGGGEAEDEGVSAVWTEVFIRGLGRYQKLWVRSCELADAELRFRWISPTVEPATGLIDNVRPPLDPRRSPLAFAPRRAPSSASRSTRSSQNEDGRTCAAHPTSRHHGSTPRILIPSVTHPPIPLPHHHPHHHHHHPNHQDLARTTSNSRTSVWLPSSRVLPPSPTAPSPPPPPPAPHLHHVTVPRPYPSPLARPLPRPRLSPDLRLYLRDCISRISSNRAKGDSRKIRCASGELVPRPRVGGAAPEAVVGEEPASRRFEEPGPPVSFRHEDHLAFAVDVDSFTPSACRRKSILSYKARANSITSDYYSDSGETSLVFPSLITEDEFILHLEHVDEETLSSRTTLREDESLASSRSTLCCESSCATPSPLPLEEAEDSRFLSHENGETHFLQVPYLKRVLSNPRFLSCVDKRENAAAPSDEGITLEAKSCAKKDFQKLVHVTRFCDEKSLQVSSFSSQDNKSTHTRSRSNSPKHLNKTSSTITERVSTPSSPSSALSPSRSPSTVEDHRPPSEASRDSRWPLPSKSVTSVDLTPVDDQRKYKMDHDKGLSHSGMSGVAPLSFSLSSLSGGSGTSTPPFESTSPCTQTNSLNRRKSKRTSEKEIARRSWGPADKEEGSRDFWASIQEPYDYIMGSHLIPDSYQVNGGTEAPSSGEYELSWDSGDVSPQYVWSFSEFMDQYNELYEWLIQVQLKLYSHSNPPDKAARMVQLEELRRRAYRRKLFSEQGERVAQRYPQSAEEISWRVNYLNNKWDQLEQSFTPLKGKSQEVEVELDLAHEEGILKRWLGDMEEQIQPLTCRLPHGCSLLTLQDRYKDNQILLKDIEAHGPVLKSVLRQYERVAQENAAAAAAAAAAASTAATTNGKPAGDKAAAQDPSSASSSTSSSSSTVIPEADTTTSSSSTSSATSSHPKPTPKSTAGAKNPKVADSTSINNVVKGKAPQAIPRKARSLEKRWHQIYLRSLEWHYYLEGVIANFKEPISSSGTESEDEPLSKCRRLSSCSSSTTPKGASRRRRRYLNDYDPNLSEGGSYIEDDYLYLSSGSERGGGSPPSMQSSSSRPSSPPQPPPQPMVLDSDPSSSTTTTSSAASSTSTTPGEQVPTGQILGLSQKDSKTQDTASSGRGRAPPSGKDEDDAMVGPGGLDAVLTRCPTNIVTMDDLLETSSLRHTTTAAPSTQHSVDKTTTATLNNNHNLSSSSSVENENQVNGNTVSAKAASSPTTAPEDDSGVNLTTSFNDSSASKDLCSPSKTSCTKVERPSPNCAIFDFKHHDTDTEEPLRTGNKRSATQAAATNNLNLVDWDPQKNRVYEVTVGETKKTESVGTATVISSTTFGRRTARTRLDFNEDEEIDQEALQEIIDSAILDPDWLNSNLPSDTDYSAAEGENEEDQEVPEGPGSERMDTGSDEGRAPTPSQQGVTTLKLTLPCSKESIHRLVSDAEKLVRESANPVGSSAPEEDSSSPVVSPRAHLQPLPLNCLHNSSKQARVRQWLTAQRRDQRTSASLALDSCDASGELTTGESDVESSASSEDMDASTTTHRVNNGSTRGSLKESLVSSKDALPSQDNTPIQERVALVPAASSESALTPGTHSDTTSQSKVVLRNRKRRQADRPWSVSELYQLTTRMDLAPFSVSEGALNHLMATPETPTNENQAFGNAAAQDEGMVVGITGCSPLGGSNATMTLSSTTITTTSTTTTTTPAASNASPNTAAAAAAASSGGRTSPSNTTSLRRRRTKTRRKSNLSQGRRTDSGSEGIPALNLSGGSDTNQPSPSRRKSSTTSKSHSSGSDTASHSRRHMVKSSSFSGNTGRGSGGMTSSTERYVSESGCVVGVPRSSHALTACDSTSSGGSRHASPTRSGTEHSSATLASKDEGGNKKSRANIGTNSSDRSHLTSSAAAAAAGLAAIKSLAAHSPSHSSHSAPFSDHDAQNAQEDMSSLSEQAWDPYQSSLVLTSTYSALPQEYKYLSEPYSEDIDQEAARRLLDFGDDYRKYIDSDGNSSFSGVPHQRGRRSPHHRRLRHLVTTPAIDLDSDSDLDDLHHVIDESKSQLTVTENVLKKYSNEAALGLDYAELVATTQTNIKCLVEILKHLEMEGGSLDPELKEVKGIVQRWEALQTQALEKQRLSSQVRELQKRVKSLRLAFEALADRSAAASRDCKSREDLQKSLEEVRECLCSLEEHKAELSSVNLYVHRFLTETGYSLTHLKEDVADLYRVYDETFKRISAEASRLEGVENSWRLWEAQAEELTKALRHDHDTLSVLDTAIQTGSLSDSVTASVQDVAKLLNERRRTQSGKKINLQATRTQGVDIQGSSASLTQSGDECFSDSGTSGYESCSSEELSERERRLAHLRRLARDLETVLQPHSAAWGDITKTISAAESELRGLQKHCRELVMRTAETLEQTRSTSPQLRRRGWGKEGKGARNARADRRGVALSGRDSPSSKGGSSWRRGGWVWRVVRAALPFQAALLLLFCVACLLEPNCCDHVNTLNLSLSPQLRYVHGPPPV
ncbi:uncharacterized protein LOC143037757 [Oratosquilla oratoria]|uniref:uncharacterized protein LOC143037757 n=1 Tax=Oratosquilla oratoria TaxID=337810 RepID=UPI003F76E074